MLDASKYHVRHVLDVHVRPDVGSLAGVEHALVLEGEAHEVREGRGDGLVRAGAAAEDHAGADDGCCDFAG